MKRCPFCLKGGPANKGDAGPMQVRRHSDMKKTSGNRTGCRHGTRGKMALVLAVGGAGAATLLSAMTVGAVVPISPPRHRRPPGSCCPAPEAESTAAAAPEQAAESTAQQAEPSAQAEKPETAEIAPVAPEEAAETPELGCPLRIPHWKRRTPLPRPTAGRDPGVGRAGPAGSRSGRTATPPASTPRKTAYC